LFSQIGHKLGNLTVAHAVLEGGHIAEVARRRLGDAVQDHLDQIIRHRTVKVGVQRQRRAAAEQRRAADLMADRAGAFIETGARG